ncbi:MAG: glycosyltransferase [Bacteroidales bacterium]|nr:glycosyltransferase [Bacteroidales bacterium]
MASCLFIVQGEGKGHLSQALTLKEYLDEAGHTVEAVLLGISSPNAVPDYFRDSFPNSLQTFRSPWFLRTPNKKGIYVGRTLLFNMIRSFGYLKAIARIRREIDAIQPDVVFNFYELLGALAMRKTAPGIRKIGIGHHFYLYLNSSICKVGPVWHRWLLRIHSRLIIKSCDRVLALSFRREQGSSTIQVVPPLVRREFREMKHTPGDRYLVYLLHEGFFYDLVMLARSLPGFQADLFTSLNPAIDIPEGIRIHPFDAKKFSNLMASCKGLITTAGFDSAAEAAFHGIPLAVVPSHNHFEQRCNSVDITANGIGVAFSQIDQGILERMKSFDCREYREWVDLAGEQIIKCIEE